VPERRVEGHLGSYLPNAYDEGSSFEAFTNYFSADQPLASSGLDARGSNQALQPTRHIVEDNHEQPAA